MQGVAVSSTRRKGRRRSQNKLLVPIVTVIVLGGLLGGAVWGGLWVKNYLKQNEVATPLETPGIKNTEQYNCKYLLPDSAWKPNSEVTAKMAVNFALSRPKPNNNMALFCRDYVRRLPSESELLDTALSKLRSQLKPLEWERKNNSTRKLGNKPVAVHLEFVGVDPNGVEMNGEVLALGYRGFGYWFYTWCPADQKETLESEWGQLRENFSLGPKREGWKEIPLPKDTLVLADLPYEVSYTEIWKAQPPEKWDPNARIVLLGHDPTESKHAGKAANFRLLVLEKAPGVKEAFDVALKYLTEKEKEAYSETVISPLKNKEGKEQISLTDLGNERGYLGKFEVRNTEERLRFMVLAAVHTPENTLMLLCDADFARKDFWDAEFAELLKSLRKTKK